MSIVFSIFAFLELKMKMQYFQYFQGLKIELIIPFKDILYKLKISGYIASEDCWLDGLSVIVTPLGMKYFEKKGMGNQM